MIIGETDSTKNKNTFMYICVFHTKKKTMGTTFWSTEVGNVKIAIILTPQLRSLVVGVYILGDTSMGFTVAKRKEQGKKRTNRYS
jgi:hypothetical protein